VLSGLANTEGDRKPLICMKLGDGLRISVQPFVANGQLEQHLGIARGAHRRLKLGRCLCKLPRQEETMAFNGRRRWPGRRRLRIMGQARRPEAQERNEQRACGPRDPHSASIRRTRTFRLTQEDLSELVAYLAADEPALTIAERLRLLSPELLAWSAQYDPRAWALQIVVKGVCDPHSHSA
jgi:hypothetical protein